MFYPLVSIIIPVHNAASFLEDTLKSVVSQTYKKLEVLIINNGSTDNSQQMAEKFKTDKIKVFTIPRANASIARNFGLLHASGDYIQFLDADDILSPQKIELQINLLSHQSEDCITSCSWGRFYHDINQTKFQKEEVWKDYQVPIQWLIDSWEGKGMMANSAWLVPKRIIEQAGIWNDSLSLNDDGEFFCRVILKAKRIVFCEDAKVYYRSGIKNSLSRQRSKQAIVSAFNVCVLYESTLLPVEDSRQIRHALMKNYINFIYEFYGQAPDLVKKAKEHIYNLGFKKLEPTGGKYFKTLALLIGFEYALKIKNPCRSLIK